MAFLSVVILAGLARPAPALAHGPVNPAASSYLATVRRAPPGVRAIVVDGDQRLWLYANPRLTVVVVDYRGAPYLRFSAHGVEVNTNSSMYYLNQVPAQAAPPGLGPDTRPNWSLTLAGHSYSGHDGRLHALATIWEGASLIGVLTRGFVLIALPSSVARAAVVLCLATGVCLLPVIMRLSDRAESDRPGGSTGEVQAEEEEDEEEAWEFDH
ncbi:MAG: hypothetical protein ABI323_06630 [Solirubrobacteraceae bacterium]